MGNSETRDKVAQKRRLSRQLAKDVRDTNGPFKVKVVNPKKGGAYKRKKIKIGELNDYTEDD